MSDALDRAAARELMLMAQLDAYRMKVFGTIGSGVDATAWDLVMIHRPCGQRGSPVDHVCPAKVETP
jgi:hypothetical protein